MAGDIKCRTWSIILGCYSIYVTMARSGLLMGLLGAAATFVACTGTIGDGADGDGKGGPGTGSASDALCVQDTPLRRLTRFEYNNTVRDLLGDTTHPADILPPEEEAGGFNNQASALTVSDLLAEQYLKVAEDISERATADVGALVPGCDPVADASGCADAFIADFGSKAFRRPISAAETTRLRALYDAAIADPDQGSFSDGIELVIQAVLQSPSFLYRPEFGTLDSQIDKTDVVRLSSWEMATKLSYMLWNTMPDPALFAAAEADELQTVEQVEAQARRMLANDKAKDAIRNFHEQWLQLSHIESLSKDTTLYPAYSDELRPLWKQEIERFIEHVILEDDGSLRTLLTADYSFMNSELAAFYGQDVVGTVSGSEFVKVDVDGSRRAGILTQAALMASHAHPTQSSPVFRGKFVRDQLMCDGLPPPPDNLNIIAPELEPDATTREVYEPIGDNPDCKGCHDLMNPIGFLFEHYDAMGVWRDMENNKPINATAEVVATDDMNGSYTGAVELAQAMAESTQIAECVTSQWFRFSYNRTVTEDDACLVDDLNEQFVTSNFNIRELLVQLTLTNTFRMRHIVDPDAIAEQGGDQ